MINSSLNFNKSFRKIFEKLLTSKFHERTTGAIKNCLRVNNTYVIALIISYDNNGIKLKKLYRLLSFFLYSLIDYYVCIDYLSCQSKTLSKISSKPIFEKISYNVFLGIGIPELLLNLVTCHGFVKKPNSTVILNFRSRLVNNYLSKGLYIIEKDSK